MQLLKCCKLTALSEELGPLFGLQHGTEKRLQPLQRRTNQSSTKGEPMWSGGGPCSQGCTELEKMQAGDLAEPIQEVANGKRRCSGSQFPALCF